MSEDTVPSPVEASSPSAPEGRYSVADDGQIFFQENITNPLPGVPVGSLAKGESLLVPKAVAEGRADVQDRLDIYIRTILEPLFKLKQVEGEGALTGAAAEIGQRLYDHLGVIHRSDLEDQIALLDADTRKLLRGKGVRLGPVLVFLPALVKPAAVKMRAMLWAIWNDKPLPIARPADGRVSEVVALASIDRHYYRMIGYPVFGPRCIRIDMLDRVVTDIYDTAQQGVFEAKHKYAEWLGCNLDDLHAILESLGHRKLKADGAIAPPPPEVPPAEAPATSVPMAPEPEPADSKSTDVIAEVTEVITQITPKSAPVIVKFMLKRGRMSDRPKPKQPPSKQQHRRPVTKSERTEKAPEEKAEKPEKKFTPKKRYDPNAPQRQERERDGGDERPRKPKFDRDKDRSREPKVYTFEGKKSGDDDDGNPFAILKNLKK
ncbi:MAG: hypothetical protein EBQ96_06385 [Proteobacteria bacterium]|nr:hypothetical protein [Pseudomonadota bacterium]